MESQPYKKNLLVRKCVNLILLDKFIEIRYINTGSLFYCMQSEKI